MGTEARKIQKKHLESLPLNKRLFAINAGLGWQGKVVRHSGSILILKNPRPLHAAPKGWPDLAGWETITVTPEMVGQEIAVFIAEEIKAGPDVLGPAQKAFRNLLEKMGGVFRIIRE